jgi:hypothetical protein
MKKTKYLGCLVLAAVLGVVPPALEAQFGIPAIVHDPINNIQLIYENGTLLQQVAESIYLGNLAFQETIALKNKQFMLAASYMSNFFRSPVGGHSSWTIGLTTAGGIVPANAVWQDMATSPFSASPTGTIQNRVQLADSMGPSMIDSIGGCNASLLQTDSAVAALETVAMSDNLLDNTQDTLGGISGVGHTQTLRMQECQHNVQLQQAQSLLIGMLRQRDFENTQFNNYQLIDQFAGTTGGINEVSGVLTADFQ